MILDLEKIEPQHPSNVRVITRRVLHTRTEITIYPNGQAFINKSQSWFEDKLYEVKKKEKPKAKEVQETKTQNIEEY